MKSKRSLIAILLAAGLCLVPGVGHGEIPDWTLELKADQIDVWFLKGMIHYIMLNPDDFLIIRCSYDGFGLRAKQYPAGVSTRGRICLGIRDNRQRFSRKYGRALLNEFKIELENFYGFIELVATDMNNDIVAKFIGIDGKTLGYFYQGEYHLWEE